MNICNVTDVSGDRSLLCVVVGECVITTCVTCVNMDHSVLAQVFVGDDVIS